MNEQLRQSCRRRKNDPTSRNPYEWKIEDSSANVLNATLLHRLDLLLHLYLLMMPLLVIQLRSQPDQLLCLLRLLMAFSRFSLAFPLFVVQLSCSLVRFLFLGSGVKKCSYSSPVELPPPFHAISVRLIPKHDARVAVLTIHFEAWRKIASNEMIVGQ